MSQSVRSAPSSPMGKLSRKVGDMSIVKTPGSASRKGLSMSFFASKTPNNGNLNKSTSAICGLPVQNVRRREVTPSRNRNLNGSTTAGGDRYIPNRSQTQFEFASFMLQQAGDTTLNTSTSAPNSPQKNQKEKDEMKRLMRTKSGSDLSSINDDRIFVYKKNGAPLPPVGHLNQPKVLYSTTAVPTSSVKRTQRHISTACNRILDAPGLLDDYYTNVLDWGPRGEVAVGLGCEIYVWNSDDGSIRPIVSLDDTNALSTISALSWDKDGRNLAVGTADGIVRIFDVEQTTSDGHAKELRKMIPSRASRVSCLSWRQHVLSAAHRSGQIVHHDVRIHQHRIGSFDGHTQEICGMNWSPDERYLASGGGDNLVNVWQASTLNATDATPLHRFDEHLATVRPVTWCPWRHDLLATGGGMQDRTVKLWDVCNGTLMKSIDTGSQVTGIVFNVDYKEMATSHGGPDNDIKIWKYPNFGQMASLSGHTARVLSLVPSHDKSSIMSSSSDETLRLWNCFTVDKSTAKLTQKRTLGVIR